MMYLPWWYWLILAGLGVSLLVVEILMRRQKKRGGTGFEEADGEREEAESEQSLTEDEKERLKQMSMDREKRVW